MKITNEVLEAHLNCRFKGHLKLAGEVGTRSDYETMTTAARAASREQAIARLVARSGEGATRRGTAVTVATLRSGPSLLVDAALDVKKWAAAAGGRDARGRGPVAPFRRTEAGARAVSARGPSLPPRAS